MKSISISEEINIIVDYHRTMQEMIDKGNYNKVSTFITEKNFPLSTELISTELRGKQVSVSIKLFYFNCDVSYTEISHKDIIIEMDKVGSRPIILPELLAIGEYHPDLQKESPVIALGSVWYVANGRRGVPVLDFYDLKRDLELYWIHDICRDYCCFPGASKRIN
jgi:hypothetical protein